MLNFNRRRVAVALLALAALVPARAALAWNHTGHTAIGSALYQSLSPTTRAKLDEILRHHPRYQQDLLANKPEGVSDAEYAFAIAGTWPDIIRDRSHPMSAAYHKSNWHYTDVPYHPEGGEEKFRGEVARPAKPGEPYDSISAWRYNLARLDDTSLPMSERAIALCWVLHIGGDVHQPCHNVSLYSPRFPTGDRGANEWVLVSNNPRFPTGNLHALWDGLLGYEREWDAINITARAIATEHPRTKFEADLKVTDVAQWVQEGRFLAIKHVYLDGKLEGMSRTEWEKDKTQALPTPTPKYLEQATPVARERAALAAYRMNDALTALTLAPSTGAGTPGDAPATRR